MGVVEKDAIIDGSQVRAGDAVIGLASSGAHSNGYSLIRKLVQVAGAAVHATPGSRVGLLLEQLLAPTRIYVKSLLTLMRTLPVHALAHITGGGLTGNIPRVLAQGLEVILQRRRWPRQPLFDWLQRIGSIEQAEMYSTFNCGIGMIAIVATERADEALQVLAASGESATIIGEVGRGERGVVIEA